MKNPKERLVCFALAVSLVAPACALDTSSPRLKNAFDYRIGGGMLSGPPTAVHTVPVLSFGSGWDLGMECGKFDPKITVSNQLNGITDGFKNMMNNIIQSATGAVASLPALAIQRADPALYDLLQQGILQGKMDFEWAETSCQEMASVMMGDQGFPFEKFKVNAQVSEWAYQIGAKGGDAKATKDEVDRLEAGNEGAEWICGVKKGGVAMPPINALRDVVIVGYNVLFDQSNPCTTASIPPAAGQGTPLWEYWSGPVAASTWAMEVVGDTEIRTCETCKKLETTPGKGLTYKHRDMSDSIYNDLEDLVNGVTPMTWQNLNRVSAPPGVLVDDTVIAAIRKRPLDSQPTMIRKLAGEIAYTRLVEQGRLLTQMLRSGVKEPNVSNLQSAKAVVNDAIDHLQVELDQLDNEIKTRQAIAKLTIQRIVGAEEREIQNTRAPSRAKPTGLNSLGQP